MGGSLPAGAMGTAFSYPCYDNKNDVYIIGTHLENKRIDDLNKSRYHPGLNLEVLKSIRFYRHDLIKKVFKNRQLAFRHVRGTIRNASRRPPEVGRYIPPGFGTSAPARAPAPHYI